MTMIARPALDAPAAEWLVYGDALQEAGVAELKKFCPHVEYSGGGSGARYRYIVGQE